MPSETLPEPIAGDAQLHPTAAGSEGSVGAASRPGSRRIVWILGGVLWICAIAAMVAVAVNERKQRADSNKEQSNLALATPDPNHPDNQNPDQEEGGQPKTLVLKMTPNADGVVEITEDMFENAQPAGGGPPGPVKPRWDPRGLEPFELQNWDGSTVTNDTLKGQLWVVSFVFTHCREHCPTVTRELKLIQDAFKQEPVRLVTLTVDPLRDTPEVLKRYADSFGADLSRWYFLTGDPAKIYGLIHRGFQMPAKENPSRPIGFEYIHSYNLILVDEQGVVVSKYLATRDEDMRNLRKEIRQRLKASK